MSMVVQHNLTAMNSNRTLGITSGAQAKSTEKLSSGYKINRAADDASGLAISEKMRKQIRGLTQASTNAQDGISAVQTAEGALAEVHDMLQRMNELAVKAANGTNSESDRSAIQSEVGQLITEIDRVAETTKFNETYLLKGDTSGTAVKGYSYSYGTYGESVLGAGATQIAASVSMTDSTSTGINASITFNLDSKSDDQNAIAKSLRDAGLSITAKKEINGDGTTQYSYDISLNGAVKDSYKIVTTSTSMAEDGTAATAAFSIQDASGNTIATVTVGGYAGVAANKGDTVSDTVTLTSRAEATTAAHKMTDRVQYYDKDGNAISENALRNYVGVTQQGTSTQANQLSGTKLYDVLGNLKNASYATSDILATQDQVAALQVKLHVGADATTNNQITMNLDAMSAKGLGLTGMRVDGADDSNALSAIETIKAAIQHVSSQRSDLGAIQNRLEHTIKNLDNVVENTTAAESQIRDTDMATEMVNYSKNNILAQAGQSMLAQANQSNQGVLSLLG